MLIAGLLFGITIVLTLLLANLKRAQVKFVQELKPNVLLTKHPLVFVTGRRSLFYFMGYWDQIPHLLASHGFDVFHLPLPWQNSSRRRKALHNFLQMKSKERFPLHLFIDTSTYPELEELLLTQGYSCLASVTHLQNGRTQEREPLARALYRPIEEVPLPQSKKFSWMWTLHRLLHPELWSMSATNSGFVPTEPLKATVLERSQFLAERDLIQSSSSPTL